jgi:hypothetical protein
MSTQPLDQNWHTLSAEILTGMHEWRLAHPRAAWVEESRRQSPPVTLNVLGTLTSRGGSGRA